MKHIETLVEEEHVFIKLKGMVDGGCIILKVSQRAAESAKIVTGVNM